MRAPLNIGGQTPTYNADPLTQMMLQAQGENNGTFLGALSEGLAGGLRGMGARKVQDQQDMQRRLLAETLARTNPEAAQIANVLPPEINQQLLVEQLMPGERQTIKDASGVPRFVDTGDQVFAGDKAQPKFEFQALMEGLDPEMGARARAMRLQKMASHAPATRVNVNTTNVREKKESEEVGKWFGKRFGNTMEKGMEAEDQLVRLETLGDLVGQIDTDLLTPEKTKTKKFLGAIGLDPGNVDDIANVEKFQSVTSKFLLDELAAQKGPQTDKDAERVENTLANLRNTPEANRFIVDMAKAMRMREIERGNRMLDYYNSNNGTTQGFERELKESGFYEQSLFDFIPVPPVPAHLSDKGVTQQEWEAYYRGAE